MKRSTRFLACTAALLALAIAPQAHASDTLDFNDLSLTGLYFPGDTFIQKGFTFTQGGDAGTIDTASGSGLGAVAPTGNSSQFYFNSNVGDLYMERTDGKTFSLDGFSAAFVPLLGSHATPQTIYFVAYGFAQNGSQPYQVFSLGDTTSTTAGSPFLSFSGSAFSTMKNLVGVDFFACALVGSSLDCSASTLQNNGQFALDNILVTPAVPEPSTVVLMGLGLLGLAAFARRRNT